MITTRRIKISNRVFRIPDLNRLARILDRQSMPASGSKYQTEYEVIFQDDQRILGTASEVFQEEELNRPSRPRAIEMRLNNYSLNRTIRVELKAGEVDFGNVIVIGGDDATWVNANQQLIEDALQKVTPQSFWFTRHQFVLFTLIATAIGSLIYLVPTGLALFAAKLSHQSVPKAQGFPWKSFWFPLCSIGWAYPVWRWILSAWPSIEFDFGNPFLRPEHRRRRLVAIWTLIILPLLLEASIRIVESAVT